VDQLGKRIFCFSKVYSSQIVNNVLRVDMKSYLDANYFSMTLFIGIPYRMYLFPFKAV
jgi:hypothetical protein